MRTPEQRDLRIAAQQAEIERLRAALTKIAEVDFYEGEWPQKVAREALSGT